MVTIRRTDLTYPSKSPGNNIFARCWEPEDVAVKAAVLIVHGMAEHGERYEGFAQALNAAGYAVWCADLLGHGRSVNSEDDLGWFNNDKGEGWRYWREDTKSLQRILTEKYPDGTPVFLFGHSMGSFIARDYVEDSTEGLVGAVFCGSSGPNPAALAGIVLCKAVMATFNHKYRSPMLDSVMFERNNARIPGKPRTKFDWLNTDEAEVDKYIDDPHCGFLFTAAGYLDLLRIMQRATRAQWYTNLPPLFPMLLIAGEDDPVGQYGKGIKTTYKKMRDLGKHKTAMSLFPGMRHEILLHPDCEKVFETVISWFDKVLAQR